MVPMAEVKGAAVMDLVRRVSEIATANPHVMGYRARKGNR